MTSKESPLKKIFLSLVVGALALTGAVLAPTAFAQDPQSCSQAQLALAEADRVHAAAVDADKTATDAEAADKAAADAKAADAALAKAENDLAAALPPVLEYNENVYPGNVRPTLAQLTPGLLRQILADPDLGGGARAEVEAALAAFAARDAAKTAAESNADALQLEADKTNAVELRRVANLTDADALKVKLDAAVKASGEACKGDPQVVFFASCTDARAAGVAPINADQPGYRLGLDTDRDGVACEPDERTQIRRAPTAINTGAA